ncbi:MAG TPA: response regulator [Bdellovibrionota bacterium]|jgi:CheY-like chemotaxis protein
MQKILVLDDQSYTLQAYKRYLENHFEVVTTNSPFEAVQFLEANPGGFFAAIVDYQIPGMNGCEVIHYLRAKRVNLPVVLCTGHVKEVVDGLLFDAVLEKPVTKDEIVRTLENLMARAVSEDPSLSGAVSALDEVVMRQMGENARHYDPASASMMIGDRSKLKIWNAWYQIKSVLRRSRKV